jgi:hypothetical protein
MLRAAGWTKTMQEHIQVWLELDERDPGIELLTEAEIATVILFNFPFIRFLSFFLSFRAIFCFVNLDYWLILMTSPN